MARNSLRNQCKPYIEFNRPVELNRPIECKSSPALCEEMGERMGIGTMPTKDHRLSIVICRLIWKPYIET